MVRLIIGAKGKGKTTVMHDQANAAIKNAKGSIIYIDRNSKHMYDLSNRIRLIDISEYPIKNSDQFIGFICGIASQDRDIEEIYLDGFMDCAKTSPENAEAVIRELDAVSNKYDMVVKISYTANEADISEDLKEKIAIAL